MNSINPTLDCTILIPTYNRPKYLKRLLMYYNNHPRYNFNISISDSSTKKNIKINKKNISLFHNLNIEHLEYSTETNIFNKIFYSLNTIKTEYCVICADDDFIIPESIIDSINFLKNNNEFKIAHGDYLYYELNNNQVNWRRAYNNIYQISDNPVDRLVSHLSKYPSPATFYAVHNTTFLYNILAEVINSNIKLIILNELYFAGLSAIYSKIISLDCLYSVKNSENIREDNIIDLLKITKDSSYRNDISRFKDNLSRHLEKESKINTGESKRIVDKIIARYMNYMFNPLYLRVKKMLYKFKSSYFYNILKKYYRKIKYKYYIDEYKYYTLDKLPAIYSKSFLEIAELLKNSS